MEQPSQQVPGESLEELFERAPCGYLTALADGTIVRVNQTLLDWLGYRREELVGRRFVDLLTLPGKVFHETHYAPLLHMQGFAHEIALDLARCDGDTLPVLLSSNLARDADGAPWYVRTTVFNASDRRKYERELLLERRKAEQAAAAKAEFLATASHEIRNQLHAIAAVTELFMIGTSEEERARYNHMLEASSSSLLSLVNDLLDYSKLEAGKLALDERPFSVRDVVNSVVASMRARAEIAGLALLANIAGDVPPLVMGDPIKISQVLTNLSGNALKFTERGRVTISVQARERGPERVTLCFVVSDTGPGIPAEQLAAISDPFTPLSSDTSAQVRSSGLGLSICKRLLALCGSSLSAESELDKGSRFSFDLTLPVVVSPATRDILGEIMARHTLAGVRVLIAADKRQQESGEVLPITQLLSRWGAEFDTVDSAHGLLAHVRRAPYDLVLMDMPLALSEGERFTRTIRRTSSPALSSLPVIALGSEVEAGQRERLASSGFTSFLGKPFSSDLLFRSIALHVAIQRSVHVERRAHAQRPS